MSFGLTYLIIRVSDYNSALVQLQFNLSNSARTDPLSV